MGQPFQWPGLKSAEWEKVHFADRGDVARLCRKHGDMGRPLAIYYLQEKRRKVGQSIDRERDALARLRDMSSDLELGQTGLTATVHDGELKRWCERHAKEIHETCEQFTIRGSVENAIDYARQRVAECGLEFPIDDPAKATKVDWGRAMARIFDPLWWRRQVRRIQARKIETVARDIRLVSASAGIYASDCTVKRRKQQRQRNRETLTALEATSESATIPMIDVVKATTANPENRRNELMVRMRGFEECATAAGDAGLFVTLTTPSRFHAMALNRSNGKAYRNPKYDGSNPREAQVYFCKLWARVRAQLWREGIRPYGFRIAEPHHDGTPHWHMMLHCEPGQIDRLKEVMTDHALADSPDEPGARKQRVKIVEIDPRKGTAAGYIAKYVSKNIDGEGIEADLYGREASDSARRIDAWAGAWGIRQFQQIGGASVTVWRELRRLQAEQIIADEPDPERAEAVLKTWQAADQADWAAYTMYQGGVSVKRVDQLIRAQYQDEEIGRYYEPVKRLAGVVADGFGYLCTRMIKWTIQLSGTAEKMAEKAKEKDYRFGEGPKRLGSSLAELQAMSAGSTWEELEASAHSEARSAEPWTCDNNCTDSGPPEETDDHQRFEWFSFGDWGRRNAVNDQCEWAGRVCQ